MTRYQLLVYGTLRAGGSANHLVKSCLLIKKMIRIQSYHMLDLGSYPIAVHSRNNNDRIVCDLLKVDPATLNQLDQYEGSEYIRHFDETWQAWIYIASHPAKYKHLPSINSGDWLLK